MDDQELIVIYSHVSHGLVFTGKQKDPRLFGQTKIALMPVFIFLFCADSIRKSSHPADMHIVPFPLELSLFYLLLSKSFSKSFHIFHVHL